MKAGDLAPDFEATLESSEKVSLNQYKGRKVVLYFYPRDNTSGCTREACDFRDRISDIQARGSVVLGVSPDSVKSHQRFKEKFDLPFSLVSDESREVAQAYGVWREKKLYGKTSMGIVRSTFIIDEEGRIARVYDKVKVAGHVDDVLESL